MAFLSSFYPQPVVAGTTEGTFAEGDDPRIVGAIQSGGAAGGGLSGTYPNPTLAPVLASGSTTARTLSDRFGEDVNILDYGAIPNKCDFTGSISGTTLTVTAISAATYDSAGYPLLKTLVVGMVLESSSITPLTKITAILTGTGGVGTYQIDISQNVGSSAMEAWYDNRLPIQRAIAGSKFVDSAEIVKNWTFDTMVTASNGQPTNSHPVIGTDVRQFPRLIYNAGFGGREVYFPFGRYKISGPLYVAPEHKLKGDAFPVISPFRAQQFNLIEDFYVWIQRQESGLDGNGNTVSWDYPWWIVGRGAFNAGLSIHGLNLETNQTSADTMQYSWYQWPMYDETAYALCTGTSGATSFTVSYNGGSGATALGFLKVGDTIRFKGFNTAYQVGSIVGSTVNLASGQTLANNITNKILMWGVPAMNGIMCSGGENVVIDRCFVTNMWGKGIWCTTGSPGFTIRDTMVNQCDVAYRVDTGPCTLIKPSGDDNNVFLQTGLRDYSLTTMINHKQEETRIMDTPNPLRLPSVYTELNHVRAVAEVGAGSLTIVGGSTNAGNNGGNFTDAGSVLDCPVIDAFSNLSFDPFPRVEIVGAYFGNWGTKIIRGRSSKTLVPYRCTARVNQASDGMHFTLQNVPNFEGNYIEPWQENLASLRFRATRNAQNDSTWCGIVVDQGSTISNPENISSGFRAGFASFTRSGTTVTVTLANHGLVVGDYVQLGPYKNLNIFANFIPLDTNGTTAFSNVQFRVMTTPNNNQFTIEVADNPATPSTGDAKIQALQFVVLHDIKDGVHRIQMPAELGSTAVTRNALVVMDKFRRNVAGLRVATAQEGDWWASKSLNMGGTIDSPASRILFGTGAPAMSAPNGSLYLRTDGDASTTLYVRAGGTWKALSSYEA